MHRRFFVLLAVTACSAVPALAEAPVALNGPACAAVTLKDDRGARITLQAPLALHRDANRFRLYGNRPLTLRSHDRRADVYRESFLELSTRAHLTPRTSVFDDVNKQVEWLKGVQPNLPWGSLPALPKNDIGKALGDVGKRAQALPGYGNLAAVEKSLGSIVGIEVPESVQETLKLRALATDEAENRLKDLGRALKLEQAADPAMRAGYNAAVSDFRAVRRDFWTAVAASLKRNQGQFALSAARQVILSPLGAWAMFGYLGWRGVETIFNAEYRGQLAICTATIGQSLNDAAVLDPTLQAHALYAQYALTYQLTEALRDDGLMALKPAGGRTAGAWEIELSSQLDELKRALTP
jgi:hypothetical protein